MKTENIITVTALVFMAIILAAQTLVIGQVHAEAKIFRSETEASISDVVNKLTVSGMPEKQIEALRLGLLNIGWSAERLVTGAVSMVMMSLCPLLAGAYIFAASIQRRKKIQLRDESTLTKFSPE